ncbi:MAG TPA: arylamine N-acetyltransferase [Verrucomicrobiae bacterium]|jgi:N-hydroxyarylamine O-acetyltransferase|nr:arylamine N-acetyltransferase [Verrucomicrobiae bacterium]
MDVETYLRRIEYDGPRQPTAATLRALHRQHLFTVPFENLDIPLGTRICLDLDGLYKKIVLGRRGGFCYELNGLFRELLTELGFRVHRLSARVRREDGGFGPEFDHMLLKVGLDEPWLVDVGFGDSFVDPIVFRSGGADQVDGHRYVVLPVGEEWELLREDDRGKVPLYRFRDVAHELSDYQQMCIFHQTSPESHFTKSWICSRATPDGRVTIANMRLIVTKGNKRDETQLSGEDDLRRCLRELFGVELNDSGSLAKLTQQ